MLLRLARASLEAWSGGERLPAPPGGPLAAVRRGVFVTLTTRGELRGCVGRIADELPVAEAVRRMTVAAAQDDPRFPPVPADEVARVHIEISVLSRPERVPAPVDPARVVIGRDGVIVRQGRCAGLLLPQVAAERAWKPAAFLAATCEKAGLAADAWRDPRTEVSLFQADVFGE